MCVGQVVHRWWVGLGAADEGRGQAADCTPATRPHARVRSQHNTRSPLARKAGGRTMSLVRASTAAERRRGSALSSAGLWHTADTRRACGPSSERADRIWASDCRGGTGGGAQRGGGVHSGQGGLNRGGR